MAVARIGSDRIEQPVWKRVRVDARADLRLDLGHHPHPELLDGLEGGRDLGEQAGFNRVWNERLNGARHEQDDQPNGGYPAG